MRRFTIEILPEAEAEFREAFLWYFDRSPVFAEALRTEVLTKIEALRDDADSWPKDEDGIRYRILLRPSCDSQGTGKIESRAQPVLPTPNSP